MSLLHQGEWRTSEDLEGDKPQLHKLIYGDHSAACPVKTKSCSSWYKTSTRWIAEALQCMLKACPCLPLEWPGRSNLQGGSQILRTASRVSMLRDAVFLHDHTAINVEYLTGDVGSGRVCGQESYQTCHLLWLPVSSCRHKQTYLKHLSATQTQKEEKHRVCLLITPTPLLWLKACRDAAVKSTCGGTRVAQAPLPGSQ